MCKNKHCFALVVLNQFPVCFYEGLFTQCDLYHTIYLYYYAESNEMIYESVNLKGAVYEPKHNSRLSVYHHTLTVFYKVHFLSSIKFSVELNRKLVQSSVY